MFIKPINPVQVAQQWREREGYRGRGGVVVVFDGRAAGWMNELRDPQNWEPGCIGVDESGQTWTAVGGDPQNGAKTWVVNDASSWTYSSVDAG